MYKDLSTQEEVNDLLNNNPYVYDLVEPAFLEHGTNWGFIYGKDEYKAHEKSIEAAAKYISSRQFFDGGNTCGLVVNDTLLHAKIDTEMSEEERNIVLNKELKEHSLVRDEKKRLADLLRRFNRQTENSSGTAQIDVAIYSITDNGYLVDNGVKYNAFCMTYSDMVSTIVTVGIKTSFHIVPCDPCAAKLRDAGIDPTYIDNVEDFRCTNNMMTVVRKNADNDEYLAGVCFKLAFKVTGH